jgi:hypothetical protein
MTSTLCLRAHVGTTIMHRTTCRTMFYLVQVSWVECLVWVG